jgi:hypothetical protein
MCRFRPNVHLDISGLSDHSWLCPPSCSRQECRFRGDQPQSAVRNGLAGFRLQSGQESFVKVLTNENGPISELNVLERSMVLHRNIERLLESRVSDARLMVAPSRETREFLILRGTSL